MPNRAHGRLCIGCVCVDATLKPISIHYNPSKRPTIVKRTAFHQLQNQAALFAIEGGVELDDVVVRERVQYEGLQERE